MPNQQDLISWNQSLERYLNQHGKALAAFYNKGVNHKVSRVQVYIDMNEGKLRADVVLDNGLYLPFVIDVDPDWESDPPPEGMGDAVTEFNRVILEAAAEQNRWYS